MPDLLFEIGAEEIPASYIQPALDQMAQGFARAIEEARISVGEIETYATPRRLTLAAVGLPETQPDAEAEVMGPPARVAFDATGKPTPAAEGFARKQGVPLSSLRLKQTPKGDYCVAVKREPGRKVKDVLAEILPRIGVSISFPKSMIWASGVPPFARPVRWVVALFGDEVVEFEIFAVRSGRVTYGHPFLSPGPIELESADLNSYKEALRKRNVLVDQEERRALIRSQLTDALREFGGTLREEWLLDDVTNLVEFPHVVLGSFDEQFLAVPAEIIETAMIKHQFYFPVRDGDGRLQPRFLVVTNRGPKQAETTRRGNEHVLRARLADAKFFWEADLRTPLSSRVPELRQISFLQGLGNYAQKTERLEKLAEHIAEILVMSSQVKSHARRAAHLCKADLLTATVGEFPSLQGIVGGLLARAQGEPPEVAAAIPEHYQPRHADDSLPATEAGTVVSLAEKVDNMVGCFVLGLVPTGSQDPYALRRQAAALIRIVERSGRHFSLSTLFAEAQRMMPQQAASSDEARNLLLSFVRDRLYQLCLDRGYPHDLINATFAAGFDDLVDFLDRLSLLKELSAMPEWPSLVTVVERTYNIGKKAGVEGDVREELFQEEEERRLWQVYSENRAEMADLLAARRYREASLRYARLFAEPVHRFFERVYVNVEEEAIRNNRLRLLRAINELFSARIADLSEIVTGIMPTAHA